MNDIRDTLSYALPIYRNDFFGAQEVMSNAGVPVGMERMLRSTNISAEVKRVSKSQLTPISAVQEQNNVQMPRRLKLSEITGEPIIKGQTNLNDANKKMAEFVTAHLSKDNPDVARRAIRTLVWDFKEDSRYINVAAQDVFTALAFFISDIDNWNGKNDGIVIPEWALLFFNEHYKDILACSNDIHSQLEGKHFSRRFARQACDMRNNDYDKALSKITTKAMRNLMLSAGEAFLSSLCKHEEHDEIIARIIFFHDALVEGIKSKTGCLVTNLAAEKYSIILSREQGVAILDDSKYYKLFAERTERLKNDLLSYESSHFSMSKHPLRYRCLSHASLLMGKEKFTPEFIDAAGRLLINAYSFPIPDKFIDNFFKG